jgi:hypothetical protein
MNAEYKIALNHHRSTGGPLKFVLLSMVYFFVVVNIPGNSPKYSAR